MSSIDKNENGEQVGNAAAMREALEKVYTCVDDCDNYDPESKIDEVISIADAALAAPARNCDRFTSIEEARTAYCSECGRMISIWDGNESWLFEDWIFATAERKGEGDGN